LYQFAFELGGIVTWKVALLGYDGGRKDWQNLPRLQLVSRICEECSGGTQMKYHARLSSQTRVGFDSVFAPAGNYFECHEMELAPLPEQPAEEKRRKE
jgi:hypothetical protein